MRVVPGTRWVYKRVMAGEHFGTDFPVTHCTTCDKDVLCYFDLDKADCEIVRCIECSTEATAAGVRWLDLHDIEELGYGFVLSPAGCDRPDCGNGHCARSVPEDNGQV
jgi:hypothetical protein